MNKKQSSESTDVASLRKKLDANNELLNEHIKMIRDLQEQVDNLEKTNGSGITQLDPNRTYEFCVQLGIEISTKLNANTCFNREEALEFTVNRGIQLADKVYEQLNQRFTPK